MINTDELNLAKPEDFIQSMKIAIGYRHASSNYEKNKAVRGKIYCSKCARYNRVSGEDLSSRFQNEHLFHYFARVSCLECDSDFYLSCASGLNGSQIAIISRSFGGISTPNTPKEVAYYLSEAAKCQSISAHSAAVVMYRSALEHLLLEQGYNEKMLNNKILKIEDDLKNNIGPPWLKDIDAAYLKVIKDLGNGAIHTNGGDITKQYVFDKDLLPKLETLFKEIIEIIYEAPIRRAKNLAALNSAVP